MRRQKVILKKKSQANYQQQLMSHYRHMLSTCCPMLVASAWTCGYPRDLLCISVTDAALKSAPACLLSNRWRVDGTVRDTAGKMGGGPLNKSMANI